MKGYYVQTTDSPGRLGFGPYGTFRDAVRGALREHLDAFLAMKRARPGLLIERNARGDRFTVTFENGQRRQFSVVEADDDVRDKSF